MKISEFFGRFIYTRKCPVCLAMLPYEKSNDAFCDDCRLKWEIAKTYECKKCHKPMCECICMSKVLSKSGALCHHKIVRYTADNPVVHRTVMFLKKNKNPRVARFLAEQMNFVLEGDTDLPVLSAETALIVPVPRSKKAVIENGFDQSFLLGEQLSFITGIPFYPAVRRKKSGREQKKLTAEEREKNVKSLFEVAEGEKSIIEGKNIILIDDVVTTGASMASCVRPLIRARAAAVICLSVASTENRK